MPSNQFERKIQAEEPWRTAVPFRGQTTWNLSGLSPKLDCGSKSPEKVLLPGGHGNQDQKCPVKSLEFIGYCVTDGSSVLWPPLRLIVWVSIALSAHDGVYYEYVFEINSGNTAVETLFTTAPRFFFFCTLYRTKKKTINLTLISNPRCLVPTSLQPDCSPERVDPIRNTAVPFWGQTAWNSTAVPSTKRGWILGIWVVCPHYSNLLWIWLVSPHNGTAVLCKGHSVRDQ